MNRSDGDTTPISASSEELKNQLTDELKKPRPDTLLIAELANSLADHDTDFVRFTVDASHVERLGYELVGKQGTALGELVKNAYDADATLVTVEVLDASDSSEGSIRVEDDGLGMSLDDIKQAWMRISTAWKVNEPRSKLYKRQRAGKKGIGRFAVQRLGKTLTLTTGQAGSQFGWRVVFDWDKKHVRGKDITLIPHQIEQIEKSPETQGTRLLISGLRDRWDETSIRMAWRSVLLLQAPLRDRTDEESKQSPDTPQDPGFQTFIDLKSFGGEKIGSIDIESEFAKSALAQISGYIDDEGTAHFEVHASTLNLHETHELKEKNYKTLGPTKIESDYFIYASDLFSGLKINAAQKIAKEIGGIRLYRNGFRVAPYGDSNDDWLKLGQDSARRAILVPSNNNNFLGRVYISSTDNPGLEETSSREGLIENEEYRLLLDFVRECIYWAVKRVGWARDRKTMANEPTKRIQGNLSERISLLLSQMRAASTNSEAEAASKEIVSTVFSYEDAMRRAQEESIRYEAMLRVLASLGLSISIFAHEVRAASSFADDSTQVFLARARSLNLMLADSELKPLIDSIEDGVDKITVLGDYLGGLTAYAGNRRLSTVSLVGVITEFRDRFRNYLGGQGITLTLELGDPPLRTCPIHRSEIDSILFNLTSNSLKAIKRHNVESGKINISGRLDRKFVVLTVSDNGSGIPEEIQDKIFDAFFTTTGADNDDDLGSGAGLGLKIVSDIASNYGGSVRIVPPPLGMCTAIEFRIQAFDSSIHTL